MKLIIGLGNPGEKYRNNRHNVGHMVIDELKDKIRSYSQVKIAKSDKFMNSSGSFVKKVLGATKLEDLYIVHDDLDIKLGEYKIQFGKGPKVHNGLNDIYDVLGTKDFWHVRVGVDSRDPSNRIKGEEYVLEDFSKEDRSQLEAVFSDIGQKLSNID